METTKHVKAALGGNDLRTLNAATLKAKPDSLPTLRMCTIQPVAVDGLIGLEVENRPPGRMEEGTLQDAAYRLEAKITRIRRSLSRFWLDSLNA